MKIIGLFLRLYSYLGSVSTTQLRFSLTMNSDDSDISSASSPSEEESSWRPESNSKKAMKKKAASKSKSSAAAPGVAKKGKTGKGNAVTRAPKKRAASAAKTTTKTNLESGFSSTHQSKSKAKSSRSRNAPSESRSAGSKSERVPTDAESEPKPKSPAKPKAKSKKHGSLYEVLGLEQSATAAEIKKAYRALALQLHPDKHANEGAERQDEAKKGFQVLQEAYEVLSDKDKRKRYDSRLSRGFGDLDDDDDWFGDFDLDGSLFREFWESFAADSEKDSFFGSLFGNRVNTNVIDETIEEYKGSEDEIRDMKELYHGNNCHELYDFVIGAEPKKPGS